MNDLETILKQVLGKTSSSSILSTTTSTSGSLYFDSGCCNHMTLDNNLFISQNSTCHKPIIHTADNSTMHVNHVGSISTSHLTLSDVFHVRKLSLNLISISPLTELGLNVDFSIHGYQV